MDLIVDFPADCVEIKEIIESYLKAEIRPFCIPRLRLEDYVIDELNRRYPEGKSKLLPKKKKGQVQQQRLRLCITRSIKYLGYSMSEGASTNAYFDMQREISTIKEGDLTGEKSEEETGKTSS